MVSWKPQRLSVRRVQCVCFAALVATGDRDGLLQPAATMSLPHCITFVIVPDPAPSWTRSTLALAPLRIVMGTMIALQLQAIDDNPDDSIRLESLTPPANMPSFVKFVPGAGACDTPACSALSNHQHAHNYITLRPRWQLSRVIFRLSHHQRPPYCAHLETCSHRLCSHCSLAATRGWRPKHHTVF